MVRKLQWKGKRNSLALENSRAEHRSLSLDNICDKILRTFLYLYIYVHAYNYFSSDLANGLNRKSLSRLPITRGLTIFIFLV